MDSRAKANGQNLLLWLNVLFMVGGGAFAPGVWRKSDLPGFGCLFFPAEMVKGVDDKARMMIRAFGSLQLVYGYLIARGLSLYLVGRWLTSSWQCSASRITARTVSRLRFTLSLGSWCVFAGARVFVSQN